MKKNKNKVIFQISDADYAEPEKKFNMFKTIDRINAYSHGHFRENSTSSKEWAFAGKIPKASRSFIDKIELWLTKKGIGTLRMFFKWNRTMTEDYLDSIVLDTKDIKITKK